MIAIEIVVLIFAAGVAAGAGVVYAWMRGDYMRGFVAGLRAMRQRLALDRHRIVVTMPDNGGKRRQGLTEGPREEAHR